MKNLKNQIIKVLISSVILGVMLYLTGAFCNVSFNIQTWDPIGRNIVGLLWIVFSFIGAVFIFKLE